MISNAQPTVGEWGEVSELATLGHLLWNKNCQEWNIGTSKDSTPKNLSHEIIHEIGWKRLHLNLIRQSVGLSTMSVLKPRGYFKSLGRGASSPIVVLRQMTRLDGKKSERLSDRRRKEMPTSTHGSMSDLQWSGLKATLIVTVMRMECFFAQILVQWQTIFLENLFSERFKALKIFKI